MKALLLTDYKRLEVADVPEPDIGPRDLLVRVGACGICGSDIHGYDGSSGRRIPPLVMGHEAAGVVAATGSEVTTFEAGTVLPSIRPCRAAPACSAPRSDQSL